MDKGIVGIGLFVLGEGEREVDITEAEDVCLLAGGEAPNVGICVVALGVVFEDLWGVFFGVEGDGEEPYVVEVVPFELGL